MRDYIILGPSPRHETGAQVGEPGYQERAMRECTVYCRQLEQQFGVPPGTARFDVRSFSHHYGTIHNVCIEFDSGADEEVEFARLVQAETPAKWNGFAIAQLIQECL